MASKCATMHVIYQECEKKGLLSHWVIYDLFIDAQYMHLICQHNKKTFLIVCKGTKIIANKQEWLNCKDVLTSGIVSPKEIFSIKYNEITDEAIIEDYNTLEDIDEYFCI